jgi:hypothetical protein
MTTRRARKASGKQPLNQSTQESSLRKPKRWNVDAGDKLMDRLIDRNRQWLKDMAQR